MKTSHTSAGSEYAFRDKFAGTWHSTIRIGNSSLTGTWAIERSGDYSLKFRNPKGARARAIIAIFQGWDGTWTTSILEEARILTLRANRQKSVGLRAFDAAMLATSIGIGPFSLLFRMASLASARHVHDRMTQNFYSAEWKVVMLDDNSIRLVPFKANIMITEPLLLTRF